MDLFGDLPEPTPPAAAAVGEWRVPFGSRALMLEEERARVCRERANWASFAFPGAFGVCVAAASPRALKRPLHALARFPREQRRLSRRLVTFEYGTVVLRIKTLPSASQRACACDPTGKSTRLLLTLGGDLWRAQAAPE